LARHSEAEKSPNGLCNIQKSASHALPLVLGQNVKLVNPFLPERNDAEYFFGYSTPKLAVGEDAPPKVRAIFLGCMETC
jgi:hypothetical protein